MPRSNAPAKHKAIDTLFCQTTPDSFLCERVYAQHYVLDIVYLGVMDLLPSGCFRWNSGLIDHIANGWIMHDQKSGLQ